MRILALDTATAATAVAVVDTDVEMALEERDDPAPGQRPRHTTRLLGLVVAALERAGWGWEDLDRLAVGVGPGTFTGLRIGVATARALARARQIPLVGVSTLQSLALADAEHADGLVVPVLDARRGEVFAAAWTTPPSEDLGAWDAVLAPRAATPEDLAQTLSELGRSCLAIGDGALGFRAVLERSGAVIPEDDSELHRVCAINHCRLAAGPVPQAQDGIRPQYLRLPDAELSRRVAQRT